MIGGLVHSRFTASTDRKGGIEPTCAPERAIGFHIGDLASRRSQKIDQELQAARLISVSDVVWKRSELGAVERVFERDLHVVGGRTISVLYSLAHLNVACQIVVHLAAEARRHIDTRLRHLLIPIHRTGEAEVFEHRLFFIVLHIDRDTSLVGSSRDHFCEISDVHLAKIAEDPLCSRISHKREDRVLVLAIRIFLVYPVKEEV